MKKNRFLSFCSIFLLTFTATAQESNNMLKNGLKLLGVPYVANTLEINKDEKLVVNCDEVDCTTFVENVLAMSLCSIQGDEMSEADFIKNLQKIRYRDGVIDGYASRLHYITDWASDNIRKSTIEDVTAKHSSPTTTVQLSFMSTHPELYKHLKNSLENTAKMAKYEKRLSGQEVAWVPKRLIPDKGMKWIKNGDIIAITTNTPGLDVSHLGLAIYIKEQLHLLHASSKQGKVVIQQENLREQLNSNKHWTGIRVLRMKE